MSRLGRFICCGTNDDESKTDEKIVGVNGKGALVVDYVPTLTGAINDITQKAQEVLAAPIKAVEAVSQKAKEVVKMPVVAIHDALTTEAQPPVAPGDPKPPKRSALVNARPSSKPSKSQEPETPKPST